MNQTETDAVKALENIALEGLAEQRRTRRWNIFFRIVYLVIGFFILIALAGSLVNKNANITAANEFTAVVDVKGVILDGADAGYKAVSESLRKAFNDSRTKGVILHINSPGGAAVQAAMIHDEVKRLRASHKEIPVYAVIDDMGASGGYYIAAAADSIYANRSSIVGSIGVRMDSFGVVEAAEKLGIESRLVTAGDHKAILDPFRPVTDEEIDHLKIMLEQTHQQFIQAVKSGRGNRLKNNPDTFSGLFWSGETAKQLGLIDGFMTTRQVAAELVGVEEMVDFTPEKSLLDRLASRVEMAIGKTLLETRLTQALQF